MGLMCWHSPAEETKTLYIKRDELSPWVPYNNSPYKLPESHPQHSRGWATYQSLHKQGWKLVSSLSDAPSPLMPLAGLSEVQRRAWS
jgi:hypothetical protein